MKPTWQSTGLTVRVVDAVAEKNQRVELDCRVGCASSQ
jgi:hypothetical protein